MQVTAFTRSVTFHGFKYKVAGELMRSLTLMLPMIAAPAVSDSNWKELVLESSVPVIVDFWAPWCGPCRMIAPLIDELAVEYGDKIKAVRPPWSLHYITHTSVLLAHESKACSLTVSRSEVYAVLMCSK